MVRPYFDRLALDALDGRPVLVMHFRAGVVPSFVALLSFDSSARVATTICDVSSEKSPGEGADRRRPSSGEARARILGKGRYMQSQQQLRFIHAVDRKLQERHRISLPLHRVAVRPSLGFFDQVFPLWIRCFSPLTSDLFRTRLALNYCVQDAAQIQN